MEIQLEVFSTTEAHKVVHNWLVVVVDSEALNKHFDGDLFSDSWLSNMGATISMQEHIKVTTRVLHELGRYFKYKGNLDAVSRIMELFYDKAQHRLIYMTVTAI